MYMYVQLTVGECVLSTKVLTDFPQPILLQCTITGINLLYIALPEYTISYSAPVAYFHFCTCCITNRLLCYMKCLNRLNASDFPSHGQNSSVRKCMWMSELLFPRSPYITHHTFVARLPLSLLDSGHGTQIVNKPLSVPVILALIWIGGHKFLCKTWHWKGNHHSLLWW